jgi:hypothetical protein
MDVACALGSRLSLLIVVRTGVHPCSFLSAGARAMPLLCHVSPVSAAQFPAIRHVLVTLHAERVI